MKNYHQLREEELKTTEKYSDKKLKRYIRAHKILLKVSGQFTFWILSFSIFMFFSWFNQHYKYLQKLRNRFNIKVIEQKKYK